MQQQITAQLIGYTGDQGPRLLSSWASQWFAISPRSPVEVSVFGSSRFSFLILFSNVRRRSRSQGARSPSFLLSVHHRRTIRTDFATCYIRSQDIFQ